MKKILFCLILCFTGLTHLVFSQGVSLLYDKSSPQAVYAADRLEKSLLEQGYLLKKSRLIIK